MTSKERAEEWLSLALKASKSDAELVSFGEVIMTQLLTDLATAERERDDLRERLLVENDDTRYELAAVKDTITAQAQEIERMKDQFKNAAGSFYVVQICQFERKILGLEKELAECKNLTP